LRLLVPALLDCLRPGFFFDSSSLFYFRSNAILFSSASLAYCASFSYLASSFSMSLEASLCLSILFSKVCSTAASYCKTVYRSASISFNLFLSFFSYTSAPYLCVSTYCPASSVLDFKDLVSISNVLFAFSISR